MAAQGRRLSSESGTRLRAPVEPVADPCIVVNGDGTIEAANPAVANLARFGAAATPVGVGARLDVCLPGFQPDWDDLLHACRDTMWPIEAVLLAADGQRLAVSGVRMNDGGAVLLRFGPTVATMRDQLAELHRAQITASRSAAEAHAAADRFVLKVAHDLRGQLSMIHGYADLLVRGGLEGELAEYAERIVSRSWETAERVGELSVTTRGNDPAHVEVAVAVDGALDLLGPIRSARVRRVVPTGLCVAGEHIALTAMLHHLLDTVMVGDEAGATLAAAPVAGGRLREIAVAGTGVLDVPGIEPEVIADCRAIAAAFGGRLESEGVENGYLLTLPGTPRPAPSIDDSARVAGPDAGGLPE